MATLSFRHPAIRLHDRLQHATLRAPAGLQAARRLAAREGRSAISEAFELDVAAAAPQIELPGLLVAACPVVLDAADALAERASWFDSTWDLQHGLEVAEGLPGDLPLDLWLQACLVA